MPRALLLACAPLLLAASSAAAQDATPQPTNAAATEAPASKSPNTARAWAIIPSAGHFYAGETGRGLAFLGGMVGVLALGTAGVVGDCVSTWDTPDDCGNTAGTLSTAAFLGLYGWSIYDAGRAAHRTNRRRGAQASLILAPTRAAASATRDVPAVKLGVRMAVR